MEDLNSESKSYFVKSKAVFTQKSNNCFPQLRVLNIKYECNCPALCGFVFPLSLPGERVSVLHRSQMNPNALPCFRCLTTC